MTHLEITGRVREYVAENFLYMRRDFELSDTDSLLANGIIDSMGVIELVAFVQEQFGVDVNSAEITEENFGTVEAVARFVIGKRTEGLAA